VVGRILARTEKARGPITAAIGALVLVLGGSSPARAVPYKYLRTPGATSYTRSGVFLDVGAQKPTKVRRDRSGIPLYLEPDTGKYIYNPQSVAQWGLQEYSYFLLGKGRAHLDNALKAGNWLLANQQSATGKWLYTFVYYTKDVAMTPPWDSALAQGQAMSLLTRLYIRTHKYAYLQGALRALGPFRLSVTQGGVVDQLLGRPFYEEYPETPPVHVLNGFILSLLGLYDLARYSSEAKKDYDAGRTTLISVLHLYDKGNRGTLYHLGYLTHHDAPYFAYCFYTRFHVILLDAMNSIRANPVFERYRDRWYRLPCGSTPSP
jgi:hypothetical protein